MIIHRWLAPQMLTQELAKTWLQGEKAEAESFCWTSQNQWKEHRHEWTEILVVIRGEMVVNVSGNQVLLRSGDRIDIPANTRHQYRILTETCDLVLGWKI